MSQINDLFDQYDVAELGRVGPKDARAIVRALGFGFEAAEIVVQTADPQSRGSVRKEAFIESLRTYMADLNAKEEISDIYDTIQSFTPLADNGLELKEGINFYNLMATANRLGEAFTEQEVKEMMEYANPDRIGTINKQEFMKLMNKTGIW